MWIRASLLVLTLMPLMASAETDETEAPPSGSSQTEAAPAGTPTIAALDTSVLERVALEPCPSSPNCVSSLADEDSDAYIAPLQAGDSVFGAMKRIIMVLKDLERVEWEQKDPQHIHAEFSSRLFGFVDDVDLVALPDGTVHVRSASRLGYWDMGANRERVEMLRERLDALNSQR